MFKHLNKILILIINFLLLGLVTLLIKNQDQKKEQEISSELVPVPEGVLSDQNKILTDRENKLRDLNNTPGEIRTTTNITTTKKTTTAPAPAKSTKKTKTS